MSIVITFHRFGFFLQASPIQLEMDCANCARPFDLRRQEPQPAAPPPLSAPLGGLGHVWALYKPVS